MANNAQYREAIRKAIEHLHTCKAAYSRTEPVTETFQGKTLWQGEVEVFDLTGHPKAKRAYGWSYTENQREQFIAVLEIPPVVSAQSAVKVAMGQAVREARSSNKASLN